MILVIDVGNTNIVLGVYDKQRLMGSWRIVTRNDKTSDEYGMSMLSLLNFNGIDHHNIDSAIVSSVVPNVMHSLINAIRKYFKLNPIVIGPGTKTGISIKSDNPREVGADRIVDAVAAYELYGGPVIVIDFGTATTYDYINEKGEFLYGITSPGIQISADALFSKTAQLPKFEIKKPKSILAKNTITSMQAGLVYGYIGQVEYIVTKMKQEIGNNEIKVISTGGFGKIISRETELIDNYDPQLLLKGLKIIHDKNVK